MKNLQKLLALLLAAAMCVVLLAACGSTASTETADDEADTASDSEAEDSEDEEEPEFEDEEIVVYLMFTNDLTQSEDVEAAINEISSERYGISLDLHAFAMGDYATQLSLAISAGETVDLAVYSPIPGSTFASVTAAGQALDISGMIDTYCPDVISLMGDYMGAFTLDGAVYGLPVARQKGSVSYFTYRTDIAEELGITDVFENAKSWDDLTEGFDAIKNNTDLFPLGGSGCLNGRINGFWNTTDISITPYDNLGDTLYLIYGDDNGQVQKIHDTDEYKALVQRLADWTNAGYVWGDTQTNTELTATQLIDQGIIACEFKPTEFGSNLSTAQTSGNPVSYVKIGSGMVTSSAMTTWAAFIPVTAAAPEAALTFYNALYTDADLMNMIDYGIEGVNYEVNDAGEACYIGEATSSDCGYHNDDWMIGNSFIMYPWEGQGSDFRAEAMADLQNSASSAYLGFGLDSSELSDLIAALSSVYSEYEDAILSGFYTDSLMEEYESRLESAGLQDYIDAVQAQVDAWSQQ